MKTMNCSKRGFRGTRAGLTLAELVVAAGILAVITVFSAQVMGNVSRVWLGGKGKSDTFTAARAVMTRMRLDIERSLPISDLPGFARDTDNDNLEFSTRVPGIVAGSASSGASQQADVRALSFVQYRLGKVGSQDSGYLIRADHAFEWDDPPYGSKVDSATERRLCPNVVGFTHRFVQRNGDLEKRFVPGAQTNKTVAVLLALAVADDRAFQTMKQTGNLQQVTGSFSSLEPEEWEKAISGESASMPTEARQGVRVFHQVVSLPTAGRKD